MLMCVLFVMLMCVLYFTSCHHAISWQLLGWSVCQGWCDHEAVFEAGRPKFIAGDVAIAIKVNLFE